MYLTIALYAPVAAPVVGCLFAGVAGWRIAAWTSVGVALCVLGGGIALGPLASQGQTVSAGPLRADALTAFLLIAVGAVATVATWAGVAHLRQDRESGRLTAAGARRYLVLVQLFLACMCAAVLADNLGLLWVAVEATTVVTAFLVGQRGTRPSTEAAWKYVVLCSVGVAIAFLGTVCVYAAAVAAGADGITGLNWTYLHAHAGELDPDLMRLAAGLILLGFGTKAGLAPMHAWLPDAHSQAPAPVSALMSGVLLSVAFYAILRYKSIVDVVLGPTYLRTLLFIAALASLAVAALLLIGQRDYKRLLAYSSIEHMGLIAFGTAVGARLALVAVLLHILGHGLVKAVAFCGAGRILQLTGGSGIGDTRGLLGRAPAVAACFGMAVVALLGLPPFSVFSSELGIIRAGLAGGYGWAVAVAAVLLAITFTVIARHVAAMLLGPPVLSAAAPAVVPATIAAPAPILVGAGPPVAAPLVAAGRPVAAGLNDVGPSVVAGPPGAGPPVAAPPVAGGLAIVDGSTGSRAAGGGIGQWAPLVAGLAAAAVLGSWLGPLQRLLEAAALVAGGR